jgi:hypothetical protein
VIPVESDDGMAKIEERVATLESSMRSIKLMIGVLVPALLFWGWYITTNVVAMKQSLADGGNTKLVTELKAPKSREQLQASLSTVIAQVQTARANGTKPDEKKVNALSAAMYQVVQQHRELPETWQAASQLVSFRTVSFNISPNLPPCDTVHTRPIEKWRAVTQGNWVMEAGYFYSHCKLDLSTLPPQNVKGTYKLNFVDDGSSAIDHTEHIVNLHVMSGDDYAQLPIYVNDGLIVFTGSQIPFGNELFVFTNCRFELSVQSVPNKPLEELLTAGLKQPDLFLINIGDVKPIRGEG